MVEEYLSDDEQGEALKNWWRENWAWVLGGIVIGVGLLFGWQYYQRYQVQRAEAAAIQLDRYISLQRSDKAKADETFKQFTGEYAATPYATQAQLLRAQQAVESGNYPVAEQALRAVIADSKDAQLATVALLRLARVQIEQGKADDALTLLDMAKAGAFAGQFHEARGDAHYAKQDLSAARVDYAAALSAYQSANVDASLLELKLEDAGGLPEVAAQFETKAAAVPSKQP